MMAEEPLINLILLQDPLSPLSVGLLLGLGSSATIPFDEYIRLVSIFIYSSLYPL